MRVVEMRGAYRQVFGVQLVLDRQWTRTSSDTPVRLVDLLDPEFAVFVVRAQIEQALTDLQEDEEMWEQTLNEIYNYDALIPTTDEIYDGIRDYVEAGGLSMDDVVGLLQTEEPQ